MKSNSIKTILLLLIALNWIACPLYGQATLTTITYNNQSGIFIPDAQARQTVKLLEAVRYNKELVSSLQIVVDEMQSTINNLLYQNKLYKDLNQNQLAVIAEYETQVQQYQILNTKYQKQAKYYERRLKRQKIGIASGGTIAGGVIILLILNSVFSFI